MERERERERVGRERLRKIETDRQTDGQKKKV